MAQKEESVDVVMIRDTLFIDSKADTLREGRRIDHEGDVVTHKKSYANWLVGKKKAKFATDEDKKKAKVSGPVEVGDPPGKTTRVVK